MSAGEDSKYSAFSSDLKPFEHQIAGHKYGEGQGMQACADGTLLKPILQDPRGEREVKFYENVFKAQTPSNELLTLKSFLPKYYGVVKFGGTEETQGSGHYFKIHDLTSNFKFPCILDIKVGKRTWDQHASKEKIASEKSKSCLQAHLGFRLCGMKVYNKKTKTHDYYDSHFCRKISSVEELHSVLVKFLAGVEEPCLKQGILTNIITKLKEIHQWFSKQRLFSFTSSSILMVYEADGIEHDNNSTLDDPSRCCQNEVKMIDFSHVYESNDSDTNYIQGIKSIIDHLEECLVAIRSITIGRSPENRPIS